MASRPWTTSTPWSNSGPRSWASRSKASRPTARGAIIDYLQQSASGAQGIIINPGAYGHYSYAIHDALVDTGLPVIEAHLSNVQAREGWRRRSVIAQAAKGVVSGFGWRSYTAALELLVALEAEKG